MKFNMRGFTSLLLMVSFFIISVTGIILYIVPPGRFANWTSWTLAGLTKAQWSALHTLFSFLFIVVAIFHIIFNWRVLIAYLKDRARNSYRLKAELLAATGVTVIVGFGSVMSMPPFGTIMAIGESIKESWETTTAQAPAPHTELRTLEEVTRELGMQTDRMLMKLERNEIVGASLDMTLQEIANQNSISPSDLYNIMQQRSGGNGQH